MSQHSIAYQAARSGAALADRTHRGRIVLSGAERRSYLHGLLTNDITALGPGQGCYATYLTAQGRMIADMWVYELGDAVLLTMSGDVKETVLAKLDQFIFSEDVQLGDVTDTFSQFGIVGPHAASAIAAAIPGFDPAAVAALRPHGNVRGAFADTPAILTRIDDMGLPGFDLYVERRHAEALRDVLRSAGVVELDDLSIEALRIEGGIPQFHRDMNEETIPLEAGIESRAISMTKGCYVGQEVIVRVLHRGHGRVARRLVGLRVDGAETPPRGAAVRADARDIGEVTSAVFSPSLAQPIALAYVHRDFVEPGTKVTVGGTPATVAAVPFVQA